MQEQTQNPLGSLPVKVMLRRLAIPAVVANVVNGLYNIVDQIFIGQGVGFLGNAATNIAFPLTTLGLAVGLMLGIGGASKFNLELGAGRKDMARKTVGTVASALILVGVVVGILVRLFLEPLMIGFGATDSLLSLAMTYTSITTLGLPFWLFAIGANALVRADGAAKYSMMAVIAGALVNTVLDPLFIFSFGWGMAGAAWATVLGQLVSFVILAAYFRRFQSVQFEWADFRIDWGLLKSVCSLGMASFIFQSSNLLVQVVANNSLRVYGGASVYGSEVAIAIAGIVMKVNVMMVALVIGVVQGSQPLCSFNYGAGQYERVRETIRRSLRVVLTIGIVFWLLVELFPKQILQGFGSGSDLYFQFGVLYMRLFFLVVLLNGVQTFSSTFFPAIGKAQIGARISMLKQLVLLIPLLLLLPLFLGVTGLALAFPIADGLSFVVASYLLYREYQALGQMGTS